MGYGEVGNQDIANYRYGAALRNYPTTWGTGLLVGNYANPDLEWEKSKKYNLGIDLGFFDNRIELIADVYKKDNTDALTYVPLPMYMGTNGAGIGSPIVNIGEIQNKGIEITLNTVNTNGALQWNTGLTVTMNRDKLTKLATESAVIDRNVQFFDHITRTEVGEQIGQFYGYVADGIYTDVAEVEASGMTIDRKAGLWLGDMKFKDLNGDGKITVDDRTFIGNPNPKAVIGLNNTFSYKGFDLTLFITSKWDYDVYNFTRSNLENMKRGNNQSTAVLDRAMLGLIDENGSINDINNVFVINPETTVARSTNIDANDNNRVSSRFVEDGTYVRIKNLTFGYSLPQSVLDNLHINTLKVYVNLQNLFTFTDYSGYDPEIGPYNQDPFLAGVDNGNYPAPRIYTLGINLGF